MRRRGLGVEGVDTPNPVFRRAMVFSTLLHLSSVTLFSIVVYFPAERVEFFDFQIVEMPRSAIAAPALADAGSGVRDLTLGGTPDFLQFPDIELPKLEFAALERLRVRQRGVEDPGLYARLFPEETPRDPWQRLTRSLRDARLSLSRTLGGQEVGSGSQSAAAVPIHRPASGFEAYIEWEDGATARRLLFAPPIQALWELEPASVVRPIMLVLKVDPTGRVVNVWSPTAQEDALLSEIQISVLKYRFEPLLGETEAEGIEGASDRDSPRLRIPRAGDDVATATLYIQPEHRAP